jgi:hypothetical protein
MALQKGVIPANPGSMISGAGLIRHPELVEFTLI